MKDREKTKDQLREDAVQVLYDSLKRKHKISKEECYAIYDKMQRRIRLVGMGAARSLEWGVADLAF